MEIRPTNNTVQSQIPPLMRDPAPVTASPRPVAAANAPAPAADLEAKPSGGPGIEELAQALTSINRTLQERAPGLEFSVDSDSDRAVVKVVDKDTNEVIRQMPSREAIDIAKALDKLQSLMTRQTA